MIISEESILNLQVPLDNCHHQLEVSAVNVSIRFLGVMTVITWNLEVGDELFRNYKILMSKIILLQLPRLFNSILFWYRDVAFCLCNVIHHFSMWHVIGRCNSLDMNKWIRVFCGNVTKQLKISVMNRSLTSDTQVFIFHLKDIYNYDTLLCEMSSAKCDWYVHLIHSGE